MGANSFVNNSMAESSKINCYGLTAGRDPRDHVVLHHRTFTFSLLRASPEGHSLFLNEVPHRKGLSDSERTSWPLDSSKLCVDKVAE